MPNLHDTPNSFFMNNTYSLCRDSLGPKRVITELGAEVLSFNLCAIRSDRARDDWF
jgi:hypothetical protein